MNIRPLRTALFLPANRATAVERARTAECDAVILDLEDAVAPDAKDDARAAATHAAAHGGFGHRLLVVRTNGIGSPWWQDDCAALADAGAQAVLVPKLSSPAELRQYRKALGSGPEIWAMLETCAGFLDLPAIAAAAADARLTTFVLGTNDLALEMRCTLDPPRSAMLTLLTQAVVAARAHGLAVIDGVFNDLADEAGFVAQCRQGALLGFDGKTVIHPKQLALANAAFAPSPAAVEQARAVVDAFADPANAGKGVIKVDGRMTEILHLRAAERTLAIFAATRRNNT